MRLLFVKIMTILFFSCQVPPGFVTHPIDPMDQDKQSIADEESLPPIEDGPLTPPEAPSPFLPLAWENQRYPERTKWSHHVFLVIESQINKFNEANDATRFCPNYNKLNSIQKINFWGQLVAGITYFESGWNPLARYHESTMGIDPVTKKPVYSEGLLQLSYQDTQWAKFCEFSWDIDRYLSPTDPKKTIFDPYKNLSCGITILANQIQRKKAIVLSSGVYWSVIKENGRYQKISKIADIVKKHSYCQL